jgi:hypothetical protein
VTAPGNDEPNLTSDVLLKLLLYFCAIVWHDVDVPNTRTPLAIVAMVVFRKTPWHGPNYTGQI